MIENRMENHAKTMLGCEVASDILFDGFLDNFGPELGSQIVVHFPKLGILNLFKFACIAKVAFNSVFGLFWTQFVSIWGSNFSVLRIFMLPNL